MGNKKIKVALVKFDEIDSHGNVYLKGCFGKSRLKDIIETIELVKEAEKYSNAFKHSVGMPYDKEKLNTEPLSFGASLQEFASIGKAASIGGERLAELTKAAVELGKCEPKPVILSIRKGIEDKMLVWVYDDRDEFSRMLAFYDAVNDRIFTHDGMRGGSDFVYMKRFKGEYPKWAKKQYKNLQD